MKTCSFLTALCSLAAFTLGPAAGADTLAEKLEEVGLGALIGTWVDPDSNGDQISVTYTWRVKDHALGMSVKTPNRTSEALIGLDPKTGEVRWLGPGRTGANVAFLALPGHILALIDSGELRIIATGGDSYTQAASYRVAESQTWAPPVLLKDKILVKDLHTLMLWSLNGAK